jgi:hypothetical protein
MAVAKEHVIGGMTLEVRYKDGIVYLDKCGSLTLALERSLGEPLQHIVPNMEYGELVSLSERLTIRYGRLGLVVQQTWPETAARLEKLAVTAWGEVGRILDVRKKVSRCGFRANAMWGIESIEEGEAALFQHGLVAETERWSSLFSKPMGRQFTGVVARADGRALRIGMGIVQQEIIGRVAPEDSRFALPMAVQLDLDYSLKDPADFSKEELQSFLRASVVDSKAAIDTFGKTLHDISS